MRKQKKDADDPSDRLAKAVERSCYLYESSVVVLYHVATQLHQSRVCLQRGRALLQHSPLSRLSQRSSS